MNTLTDSELNHELEFLINQHIGEENPMERWGMVRKIFGEGADWPRSDNNPYDRRVRDAVERLRPRLLICDMGDGRGRFRAKSFAEYMKFRERYVGRAYPILKTTNAMDETARKQYPDEYEEYRRNKLQPMLFDMSSLEMR